MNMRAVTFNELRELRLVPSGSMHRIMMNLDLMLTL